MEGNNETQWSGNFAINHIFTYISNVKYDGTHILAVVVTMYH